MDIIKKIRIYDFLLSLILMILFSPILLVIYFICFIESGRPLFFQKRLGKNKETFYLIKFRTMDIKAPSLASHLVNINLVTRFGRFIRFLKLDELPQLINVIKGDMSLVGPRPCLTNQFDLIKYREIYNVFSVKPGITGLGQIKRVDMSTPEKLAKLDFQMIANFNQFNYFKYLFLTVFGKGFGDGLKNKLKK